MLKKLVLALGLFGLVGIRAEAAETDLQRIADALGVSSIKTFQFNANARMYAVGQSTSPMAPWPRYYVKSLTRVYDLTAGAMRDVMNRTFTPSLSAGGAAWDRTSRGARRSHQARKPGILADNTRRFFNR